MGIFTSMTGRGGSGYGGSGLQTSTLMAAPQGGITPMNPGTLQNIDLPKSDPKPRMYSMSEADQATRAADVAEAGAEQATRAYAAQSRIVAAAAKTQVAHRKYVSKVADATTVMIGSNVALGQHLHGLRESYAKFGFSTDRAAETAQQRVDAAQLKFRGI